ncbi:hypothetical protein Bca4012_061372 [Brassica carinata]
MDHVMTSSVQIIMDLMHFTPFGDLRTRKTVACFKRVVLVLVGGGDEILLLS